MRRLYILLIILILALIPYPSSKGQTQQILTDGDFEFWNNTNDLTYWLEVTYSASIIQDQVAYYSGSNAMVANSGFLAGSTGYAYARIEQNVSGYWLINFSYYYRVEQVLSDTNLGDWFIKVRFYSGDTLVYEDTNFEPPVDVNNYYQWANTNPPNIYFDKVVMEVGLNLTTASSVDESFFVRLDLFQVYATPDIPSYFDNHNMNGKYFDPGDTFNFTATLREKGSGNTVSNQPTYLNLKRYTPSKVVDLSGNNNHGTVYGNAEVIGSPYDDGMALRFDGTDDYVEVLDSSEIQFDNENFSIELFFYRSEVSELQFLVLKGKYITDGWRVFIHSDNRLYFETNQNGTYQRTYSNTLSAGVWIHAIITRVGQSATIYINATDQTALHGNHIDPTLNTRNLIIGQDSGTGYFNGSISLVRIYNRSLSASEVQQNYQSVVFGNVSYVSSGLVLYFEFDSFQESSWIDISGNNNHGTAYGNLVNKIDRDTGRWVWQFDGTNKYIEVPYSSQLNTPYFTYIAFINPSPPHDGGYGGLWHDQYTTVRNRILINDNGQVLVQFDNLDGVTDVSFFSSSIVSSGQWVMVVVQYDGSQFRVYGNLTLAGTYNVTGSVQPSSNPRWIGKGYSNTYYFNGSIAQVLFYNRSLTTTELNQIFNAFFYGNTSIVWDGLVLYLDASYLNGNVISSYTANTDANGVVSYSITLPSDYGPYMAHIISNQTWIAEDWRWIYVYKMQLTEYGVADTRVDLGSTVSITGKLRHPLLGFIDSTIYINNTAVNVVSGSFTYNVSQNSVGKWRYQVTGVSYDNVDTYYGVTDYIDIIWDALQISVSQAISGDGYITYSVSIVHVYDNLSPSNYTVWINGSTYSNQNQITLPLSGTVRMFKAVSGDYGITYPYNTVYMYLNPVSEPQGSTFYIIRSDGIEITNRSWDDNNKDLIFEASGNVEVYVGDWLGNFKQVIVNENIYTDYSVNNNYRTIYINNLASNVVVDFELAPSGGGGGGGGGSTQPQSTTPASPVLPSPETPRIPVESGVALIILVVASIFIYRKIVEEGRDAEKLLGRRFKTTWKERLRKWRVDRRLKKRFKR